MNRSAGWEQFQVAGPAAAAVGSDVVALSRRDDHLEVWWTGRDAFVHGGFWYADGHGWQGPYQVPGPVGSLPQGGIAAASRRDNTIETWWVGTDTSVRGAFWYDDGNPWRAYGDTVAIPTAAAPDSGMAAVSRIDTSMEVWWIGLDGSVQGAFWYQDQNDNRWQRYTLAGFGSAAKSTGIAAVSRKPVAMEIWWVRSDGAVEGAFWYEDGDKVWHTYSVAPAGSASQSHSIAAVSRRDSSMDVVWITPEGAVRGAYWNEGDDWELYPDTIAESGSASTEGGLAAVSRSENNIEVWWIAPDGSVQGACWHDTVGWRRYDEPVAEPGSASKSSGIHAVSRIPTTTEVFWVAPDGAVMVAVRDEQSSGPFSFRIMRPDDLVHLECDVVGCRIEPGGGTTLPAIPDTYVVKSGDTLWDIAERFYGNPFRYRSIADLNKIANPDLIFPGQVLGLPRVDTSPSQPQLVAVDANAHIVVSFGIQHIFEQAYPEPPGTAAGIAAARAANDSRVVFALSPGTKMPYTVSGVLGALSTLGLRVVPLAVPRVTDTDKRPDDAHGAPAAPAADQTAIEAPYRLVVSPDGKYGGFAHSANAGVAPSDPLRIELWHSRLAVRQVDEHGNFVRIDEDDATHRTVRPVWTRDNELPPPGITGSLSDVDRKIFVTQSADPQTVEPEPFSVDRLYLSALGAWIDWRVAWNDELYTGEKRSAYRHLAPLGRDQYVRVETPVYLFPFGHRGTRVQITERKIRLDGAENPAAYLFTRSFIVLREHTRRYDAAGAPTQLPFVSVTIDPIVSPDLDPIDPGDDDPVNPVKPFVPKVGGTEYPWKITGVDHAGRFVSMSNALVVVPVNGTAFSLAAGKWVDGVLRKTGVTAVGGAEVAFAPELRAGDTTSRVQFLEFAGAAQNETSTPSLFKAHITIPALAALNRGGGTNAVSYRKEYVARGFPPGDKAELYLMLDGGTKLDFAGASDRGGGFVEPSVAIKALSRQLGAIGDDGSTPGGVTEGKFNPANFLGPLLPKLFGLLDLTDILNIGGPLAEAPKLIGEQLGFVASVANEYTNLTTALQKTADTLKADSTGAAPPGAKNRYAQLLEAATVAQQSLQGQQLPPLLDALGSGRPADAAALAQNMLGVLGDVEALYRSADLATFLRSLLQRSHLALQTVLTTATDATKLLAALQSPVQNGAIHYDWFPTIKGWPDDPDEKKHIFHPNDSSNGLAISVDVRTAQDGTPQSEVTAQLRDFELRLLPDPAQLIKMKFGRVGFRVATGGKPEVDVQFNGMEFVGVLEFIENLRQVIPLDGFSDPPYVDVSPAGATAGFDLALPSLAIGVFTLQNIRLGADCRVPFLGDAVTVGFFFCTKEAPFRLTVLAIGGGGWVGIRLAPKGLVLLEMGLEAGAELALDFGVASGSVSVMVGVYLRLEDTKGQLTGYFRIRGEVEVLGIASASITLELSMTYDFASHKLVGRASLRVEVEVLFFSASVEITCERKLAGSKADPALIDTMPPDDGGQDLWNQYYSAFAIGG